MGRTGPHPIPERAGKTLFLTELRERNGLRMPTSDNHPSEGLAFCTYLLHPRIPCPT